MKSNGKVIVFLVQVVLVILKLAGVLNVGWLVILLPTLLPCAGLGLLFIVLLIGCIASPKFKTKLSRFNERFEDEENN